MPYVFNPFTGNLDWTAEGIPALSTGGVTFGSSTGTLTQDNTNFNYTDSTDTLGVSSTVTERITNGTFSGSATGWNLGAGWNYTTNTVAHNANGTGNLQQYPSINIGERYEVTFTLSNFTTGSVGVYFGGNTLANLSAAGTYKYRVVVLNSAAGITFTPTNTSRFVVDDVSAKLLDGGAIQTGNAHIAGSNADGVLTVAGIQKNNYYPGTTKHLALSNTGSYTWIDFSFSGVNQAHIGATSAGEVSTWITGGNGQSVYYKPSGQLISYNNIGAFSHYGHGLFGQYVSAGYASVPTSTLTTAGGTALKVKYITTSQTLDNTATKWIVDASTPICTGTPTNACSSYTSEYDCTKFDAHGGCTWFAGYSCSVFNGDQTSCEGQSGCTYETASCSGFGDQTNCESYSGCSWTNNPQSCAGFDQMTCDSTMGCTSVLGYCTPNYDYCSNYSDGGGDGTACNAANGGGFCSYDSGTGACTGGSWYISCSGGGSCSSQPDESSCTSYSYYDYCSGTYDSYSCTGSYYTGNCTGTYGTYCSGTATCSGINDSTNCGDEAGCTWTTAATLTLPNMVNCPDRDYWIYNGSSSNADVILMPYSGQQVDHTTSYTLSNYKDWVHISPYRRLGQCSDLDESGCNSTSGCTASYPNCSWDGANYICTGGGSCSSYGDESSCNSATYYGGCSGTYVLSENWYVFGK